MTFSTDLPTIGTRTLELALDLHIAGARTVVALLEPVGPAGAQPVGIVVGQHHPAGTALGEQDLGAGDPRHLRWVDHGAHRRRQRTREGKAHLQHNALGSRLMAEDVAHLDVVTRRAPLVERRRAVGHHRPLRRDGDRLPDGEFHVAGRDEGSPNFRWSQLTVRSTFSFTATRLCSMISRIGLRSSEYGPL